MRSERCFLESVPVEAEEGRGGGDEKQWWHFSVYFCPGLSCSWRSWTVLQRRRRRSWTVLLAGGRPGPPPSGTMPSAPSLQHHATSDSQTITITTKAQKSTNKNNTLSIYALLLRFNHRCTNNNNNKATITITSITF